MASKKRASTGTPRGKAAAAKAPARRKTPRKKKAESAGLDPQGCLIDTPDASLAKLEQKIAEEGGAVVGHYKDPLGGHAMVLAVLPITKVEPTPFQRDLCDAHHKRLADVIEKTGRYLDPVIAITAPEKVGGFWTPNGRHRLAAMQRLGAKSITALVVPTREVAWQILALNTEKAHNLKERSLEVIRIYRGLLDEDDDARRGGLLVLPRGPGARDARRLLREEPALRRRRVPPGPATRGEVQRRADRARPSRAHEKLAELTLEVEEKVAAAVAKLREKGLMSPYLRSFVVARINPLRWIQGELPSAEKVLTTMRDRAAKFNAEKVRQEDLARMGGGVPDDAD